MITIFLVIIFSFLLWRGTKGPSRTLDELKQSIIDLDKRGLNHSTLIIDKLFSKKFVQFRKLIDDGESNIQLSFPNATWSKEYFPKVLNIVKNDNLNFSISQGEQSDKMEFLYINFKKDVGLAHSVMAKILLEVFKEDPNSRFHVLLNNQRVR